VNVIRHDDVATQCNILIKGDSAICDQSAMDTIIRQNGSSSCSTEGNKKQRRIVCLEYSI